MKKTSLIAIVSIAFLTVFSCDRDYHEVFAPDELGMADHNYYVGDEGGDVLISFLANKKGTISFLDQDDRSWVQLGSTSFSSDDDLSVHVLENDGFKRRADILFTTETRKDTASIFQLGKVEEKFYVSANSMMVFNGTGEVNSIVTDINIPLSNVKTEVIYPGSDEWIKNCTLTSSTLSFETDDNPDKDYMRRAYILLTYTDGWGEVQRFTVVVKQARSDNNIGTVYTAESLRSVATITGYTLPDDAVIEGYIVSTTEGSNAGEAQVDDYRQGTGVIDYTLTERTSYLVSADGQYGFRLVSRAAEDNGFERYSYVSLNIGGSRVKKSDGEPVCYTIEGISSDDIITSTDGYSTMPWKEKHMSELTDNDINTLVKIKDCEIAMRKGPFTPVNEGYSSLCGYNRVAKYPILIRDIEGSSMYMFTNMTCPYRRNGETLPYGSGDITGIVVHEPYKSFERDGNIGRYQLRHLIREEIDLRQDFADNFSGLITEFRYVKYPGEFEETLLENAILATKGNGEMCHTYGAVSNYSSSYFYIGKCGTGRKNKYAEGAGIELDGGGIYEPWIGNEGAQNTDGKGWFDKSLMLSWSNKNWWDSDNSRGYCWLVNFSTEGIVSDKVSMQFAMYNNSTSARSPRYWKAQYSLTTIDTSSASDSEWIDIGEFAVPDVARWGNAGDGLDEFQTVGTRVYDFPLPTEILGKPSVSIRLMPRNNRAAENSVGSYDNSTIKNGTGYNTMDYFAVRYNK